MGTVIEAKWPDGRKLLRPDQFVITRVVNVEVNDTLKLRSGPGASFTVLAKIPADETNIIAYNYDQVWDGVDTYWVPVEWRVSGATSVGAICRSLSKRRD
jgi:hypothetical protein